LKCIKITINDNNNNYHWDVKRPKFPFIWRWDNYKNIVIEAIYILPNQNLEDIVYFIQRSLPVYSHTSVNALGRGENKIPMILGEDFNVNFGSNDSLPMINFLRKSFGLLSNNNPKESKSGTTKDAIFTRYLENIESRTHYISYISHHQPIVSTLAIEPPNDDSVNNQ